jgi:hypothetical protein
MRHVARIEKFLSYVRFYSRQHEENILVGNPKCGYEDDIKLDLIETQ